MDVFSHPWLGALFADPQIQDLISADSQLRNMLKVEASYARALGDVGKVPAAVAEETAQAIQNVQPDVNALRAGTATDGLVIPALVQQIRNALPQHCQPAIHKGLTSQDVLDTALVLSVKDVLPVLQKRIQGVINTLDTLEGAQGANPLMGRTRMQAALPIRVADRLRSWKSPLTDHLTRLSQMQPRVLALQLGGAVGDRAAFEPGTAEIADAMAKSLDLANPPLCWHTRRDGLAELAGWLSMVTGSLGKIGQDVALMAQQGIDEIALDGGGGSSAMPHKQNPIRSELLISLARFNAVQLSGMHQALVHEQERSGAAWTLEWMLLPQMIVTTGSALISGQQLLDQVERIGDTATY